MTSETSVHGLDQAVYGRRFGIDAFGAGVGLDLAIMKGTNRPGFVVVVAPKIGLSGGLMFPKMTFSKNIK